MTIESNKYVANLEDIRKLTRDNVEAQQSLASTRKLYFQALVGTTRAELSGKGKSAQDQLAVLRVVHRRFYVVIKEVIRKAAGDAPRSAKGVDRKHAVARNAKSNFARSAFGTISRWVKAGGHDMMDLAPATLTEQQLRRETPVVASARKTTPERAHKRVDTLVKKILAQTRQLAHVDSKEARAVLDEVVNRVTRELFIDSALTKDPNVAAKERRPLRLGKQVYWPTTVGDTRKGMRIAA